MKKFKPKTTQELKEKIKKVIDKKGNNDIDLNYIDTSLITDMSQLFAFTDFNGKIDKWDVSNVTNMRAMFLLARKFNQPLNKWDVSNVIHMDYMFNYAQKFSQPLNNWNVKNVNDSKHIFTGTNIKTLPFWYFHLKQ